MRRLATVLVALPFLLVGCGGDDDGDAGSYADAVADLPDCSDVWVDGEKLPDDYEGCIDDDTVIASTASECASGDADLVTYEPDGSGFFTLSDGTIIEAGEDYANTPEYGPRFDDCL